jgi:hypothetical protein
LRVLNILRVLAAVSPSLMLAPNALADIEATPENNNALAFTIGAAFGAHLTGTIAGFVPWPVVVGITGEGIALASDLVLKSTPPVFERIPNKVIPTEAGGCQVDFDIDMDSASRNNILGFTYTHVPGQNRPVNFGLDNRDWGRLVDQGEMFVLHLNTDVNVSVSNPNIAPIDNPAVNRFGEKVCEDRFQLNDDSCFRITLKEGIHSFHWQAQTIIAPFFDVILPSALFAVTLYSEIKKSYEIAKLTKNGAILEEIISNPSAARFVDPRVADDIRLDLVRKILKLRDRPKIWKHIAKQLGQQAATMSTSELVDFFARDRSLAKNQFTQLITVPDTHTPTIVTTIPNIELEATDFGGTRFARVREQLIAALDYQDACDSSLRLTHNAPDILPIGSSTMTWTVTDVPVGVLPGDYYAAGVQSFATVVQPYIVADTQPPLLVAPPDLVIETPGPSVDPSNLDLGIPMVIDLADPEPTISNNVPPQFNVDSRVAVEWTATDASTNANSKVQWITAKTPGTNSVPVVAPVVAATRTAEEVEIRLDGIDMDLLPTSLGNSIVDPLSFEIAAQPANGEFVAPLHPFFIEDFRLTPVGETDVEGVRTSPLGANAAEFAALPDAASRAALLEERYCDLDLAVPINFAYRPTYVHVADSGNYYIRDSYWECTGLLGRGTPVERERISKWNRNRQFLRHYRLREAPLLGITQSDIFTVDTNENVWWSVYGSLGNVLGVQRINSALTDVRRLVMVPLLLQPDGRSWTNAHGDPNTGLVFVNDNRGIAVFKAADLEASDSLADFLAIGNQLNQLGRLTINGNPLFFPDQDCGLDNDRKFWMATDSDSNLYVAEACQNKIHKFGPSQLRVNGSFVAGEYIGWMGRCSANIPPWSGCDEDKQVSQGYACRDDRCLRGTTNGTAPGQFNRPVHIAVDPNDILYVADFTNQRVQRFGVDGSFAGQAVSEGSGINTGDSPGFVLGNIGEPRAVAVNSDTLFVMQSATFDYFLHSFKTIPFDRIEASGGIRDEDQDGYEDNSVIIKYVPRFDFPGGTGQPVGQDQFSYRVNDGLTDSVPASVTITVSRNFRAPEKPEMHCFRATAPGVRVECELNEDTDILLKFIARDPDGIIGFDGLDTLSYTPENPSRASLTLQSSDAASATYLFVPNPDVNGEEAVAYSVSDDSTMDANGPVAVPGQFTLNILPVPDPPVLALDEAPVAGRGFDTVITASYTDVDDDPNEAPPTLSVNWGDGVIEAQGEIVEDANGDMSITGPLLTPITPAQGQVQGSHLFDANGVRQVTVCLAPTDVPGPVCAQHQIEVIDATNVSVLVTPVDVNSLPAENFVYVYNVNVTNVAPQGWNGLTASAVQVLIDIPPNMLPHAAGPGCNLTLSPMRYRCVIGDMAPGDEVDIPVMMLINPLVAPRPKISVDATVIHQSVDVSDDIESSAVILIEWPDTDSDGLPDRWEQLLFYSLTATSGDKDEDGDGLDNSDEYFAVTSPFKADSDGDSLSDFAEVNEHFTDPTSPDTDGDSLPDAWEIMFGVDPHSAVDSLQDHDNDLLATIDEYAIGTDPQNPDTDADTRIDGLDNCPLRQNPHQTDFDGDGSGIVCDGYSVVDIAALRGGQPRLTAILQTRQLVLDVPTIRQSEVRVIDASSGATVTRFDSFDADWTVQDITTIPGMTAVGVSATRDGDGLIAIEITDPYSADTITTLYPFASGWRLSDTEAITDPASGNFSAMAALGQRDQDGLISVEVRDADSDSLLQGIDFFVDPLTPYVPLSLNIMEQGGRAALVAIARNELDGSTLIEARFADDGTLINQISALDHAWTLVQAVAAADLDNDAVDKVAVLLRRESDNLSTVLVIDISQTIPVRQLMLDAAISADWRAQGLQIVNYNGADALGVMMVNDSSNSTQAVIADAMTGSTLQIADFGPVDYRYRHAFASVPNINANGASGLAVVSEQIASNIHRLQINEVDTGSIVSSVALEFGAKTVLILPRPSSGVVGPLLIGILLFLLLLSHRLETRLRPASWRQ